MKPILSINPQITRLSRLLLSAAVAAVLLPSAAFAASDTWKGPATPAATGNFASTANWVGGTVPGTNPIGTSNNQDFAKFVTSSTTTVNLASDRQLRQINFGDSGAAVDPFILTSTTTAVRFALTSGGHIEYRNVSSTVIEQTVNAPILLHFGAANASTSNSTQAFRNSNTASTNILRITGTVTGNTTGAANTLTLDGVNTGANEVSGVISKGTSSAVAITKTGGGTWILSGANDYTGLTTVSSGVLNIRNDTALGSTAGTTTVATGAALEIQNDIIVGAEALSLSGTGISAGGALRNISGTNEYGGTVTISSAAGTPTRINSDAGKLTLNSVKTADANTNRTLTLGGAGNGEIAGTITFSNTVASSVTKDGEGTWTLSNIANNYALNSTTGATNINGGILNVAKLANGALSSSIGSSSSVAANLSFDGGTLQFTGSDAQSTNRLFTINANGATLDASGTGGGTVSFTGPGALNTGTGSGARSLTLTGSNIGDNTLAATLANNGSGAVVSLNKSGLGKWVLGGANTYTGNTTISGGGTLAIGASGSVDNSAEIIVGLTSGSASTLDVSAKAGFAIGALQKLSGFGNVTGNLTVNGTLAPGASPGTMTFNNNLTLGGGANSIMELASTSSFDQIDLSLANATNTLAYGGTLTVQLLGGFDPNAGNTFQLFSNFVRSGSTAFDSFSYAPLSGGKSFTFDHNTGILSVVPEPSTFAMLLGGFGMLLAFQRSRRRS